MTPGTDRLYDSRVEWVGQRLRRLPLVSGALEAMDRRRLARLEGQGDAAARAKSRWQQAAPDPNLTWGFELTGDAFVAAAEKHGAFGPGRAVVEVGPGYGRILRSCLERGVDFASYTGVDLSAANVERLSGEFGDPRVQFLNGDAESVSLPGPADTVLSSLTLKHFYPDFTAALSNLAPQLSPDAVVLFDLIEGERRYFHVDRKTFIHEYSRREVEELLPSAGMELRTFDVVDHDPEHARLLVVAGVRR